ELGVNDRRALRPLGPAGLPCLPSRCHVTPPSGLGGSDGRCVSGCSSDRSIIPGQELFVVTPSGIEHSRSSTGTKACKEKRENREPRATPTTGLRAAKRPRPPTSSRRRPPEPRPRRTPTAGRV